MSKSLECAIWTELRPYGILDSEFGQHLFYSSLKNALTLRYLFHTTQMASVRNFI